MDTYEHWLMEELRAATAALAQIPPVARKGTAVGVIRLRAREVETALKLLQEFGNPHCLESVKRTAAADEPESHSPARTAQQHPMTLEDQMA
jgi:hypothetical protein